MAIFGQKAFSCSFGSDTCYKGLGFHSRLRGQRRRNTVKIPRLIPLVAGKCLGQIFCLNECVWAESGLDLKCLPQGSGQWLLPYFGPVDNTSAGRFRQIIFQGRKVLQNLR